MKYCPCSCHDDLSLFDDSVLFSTSLLCKHVGVSTQRSLLRNGIWSRSSSNYTFLFEINVVLVFLVKREEEDPLSFTFFSICCAFSLNAHFLTLIPFASCVVVMMIICPAHHLLFIPEILHPLLFNLPFFSCNIYTLERQGK